MPLQSLGEVNFPRETTIQKILEAEQQRNDYLAVLAAEATTNVLTDYAAIQRIVRQGLAPKFFEVGDQINAEWKDAVSNTTYTWQFNVVHFGDVELKNGEVVPGMYLQAHYCNPFNFQFDQSEALYYTTEDLPAGVYYFTIGTSWGTHCVKDSVYYFTTAVTIPAGGQIRIGRNGEANAWGAPDLSPSSWCAHTYESPSATSPLETNLALSAWSEDIGGTNLGTTLSTIKFSDSGINNLQRAAYGYNRWSQSGIRQYLNSAAAIGKWWTPQNNFDRPPAQLATYPGFMSGFDESFLNILKPVKVTTALNTVSDSEIGAREDTYDTFFLASLEQQNITPQLSGVEGDAWEYWKRALGLSGFFTKLYTNGAYPVTYAINAKTSPQSVRLRSANRGSAHSTWYVGSSGTVSTNYASNAYRFAPACVVC